MVVIIPAILSNNLKDFNKKLNQAKKFAKKIQIDVADGKFVPNKTLNLKKISLKEPNVSFEFHLMVKEPEVFIPLIKDISQPPFSNHSIVFHIEPINDPLALTTQIKNFGFKAGVALNPQTELRSIFPFVDIFNLILFLTVEPGFQGHQFKPLVSKKIRSFRQKFKTKPIGVDGGINGDTIFEILPYNVNEIVVGSYLWQSLNPALAYQSLKNISDNFKI